MIAAILVALVGGMMVGMSRSLNGRLGVDRGAFRASFWNHAGGFAILTVLVIAAARSDLPLLAGAPLWAFSGGLVGAVFVALSSYVFPRLGAARSALLIIAGQMIAALVIDSTFGGNAVHPGQIAGVLLMLGGIYLTRFSR